MIPSQLPPWHRGSRVFKEDIFAGIFCELEKKNEKRASNIQFDKYFAGINWRISYFRKSFHDKISRVSAKNAKNVKVSSRKVPNVLAHF